MTPRRSAHRVNNFERQVYGVALKNAIRLGGGFKALRHRQHVITLRLPAGANTAEYETAAHILVTDNLDLSNFSAVWPKMEMKGKANLELITDAMNRGVSFVIVWPPGRDLPLEVELASDRVVDVEPVRPYHLVVAAKIAAGQVLELSDAKALLQYPLPQMFAAMRSGRPAADVLRKLKEARQQPDLSSAVDQPSLDALVGYGEAKTWGLSLAADLREWKEGRLSWRDVDRGLLLSGPPGTGKTLFAGALAQTCGAHLVATSVARWQSAGYLNDVLTAIRRSFQDAVANKPSILFIDELDAIGDRTRLVDSQHKQYWTQAINLLLELMDGHSKLEGVVIVGATNYPGAIDPALLRSGRLDRHLTTGLPDLTDRQHLARTYFGHHLSSEEVARIAGATAGFTGADFEQAGRAARREARRAKSDVSMEMIMRALPPAMKLEGPRRRTVAIHEAGHAVVAAELGIGTLEGVFLLDEVRPPQPYGLVRLIVKDDNELSRQLNLDRIAFFLAGRAAEEELLGNAFVGAGGSEGSDLHMATDLATEMEVLFGMGEGVSHFDAPTPAGRDRLRRINPEIAARVERVLVRELQRSRDIVKRHRRAIEELATALEKTGHVEGADVARILDNARGSVG
jgi:cell division protease FtsH